MESSVKIQVFAEENTLFQCYGEYSFLATFKALNSTYKYVPLFFTLKSKHTHHIQNMLVLV